MDIHVENIQLNNIEKFNVIIGKNGCGKSTILRLLDKKDIGWSNIKYISPERGGDISFLSHVDQQLVSDQLYLSNSRRVNHDQEFRAKSLSLLKSLETLVSRRILSDKARRATNETFQDTINTINDLLDNVRVELTNTITPLFIRKSDNASVSSTHLSSGEKELITLAIEIIHFCYEVETSEKPGTKGILLLDEPDVHLHPDLQYRLVKMLASIIGNLPIDVILSTHSTVILSALAEHKAHVCFMKKNDVVLEFQSISETLTNVLPVFGAHPLSNVFNEAPILIVEGNDDERIWQQAVRSSQNRLKIWPCEAGSIDKMNEHELVVSSLISSVYDNAAAFSLRDKDSDPYEINNLPNILRARLNCYSAENLFLSDDVLNFLGTSWDELKVKISEWITITADHKKLDDMTEFAKSFDRRNYKIKELVFIFLYLIGNNKPWEVLVGQTIAKLNSSSSMNDGSLRDFLGSKIVDALKLCQAN